MIAGLTALLLPAPIAWSPAAASQSAPSQINPICRRTSVRGDSLAQELTRLIADPQCAINGASLVPLAPRCSHGWRLRQTRALPGPWWWGPVGNSLPVSLQDGMIMQARHQAVSSPAPTGMQLLRVHFTDRCTIHQGGMQAGCRISAVAEFGVCR
jgi:hypothetical protein